MSILSFGLGHNVSDLSSRVVDQRVDETDFIRSLRVRGVLTRWNYSSQPSTEQLDDDLVCSDLDVDDLPLTIPIPTNVDLADTLPRDENGDDVIATVSSVKDDM